MNKKHRKERNTHTHTAVAGKKSQKEHRKERNTHTCSCRVKERTTPKFPPPPRSAQKSSIGREDSGRGEGGKKSRNACLCFFVLKKRAGREEKKREKKEMELPSALPFLSPDEKKEGEKTRGEKKTRILLLGAAQYLALKGHDVQGNDVLAGEAHGFPKRACTSRVELVCHSSFLEGD